MDLLKRQLERRAEVGDLNAIIALLNLKLKTGELSYHKIKLAGLFGYLPAQQLLSNDSLLTDYKIEQPLSKKPGDWHFLLKKTGNIDEQHEEITQLLLCVVDYIFQLHSNRNCRFKFDQHDYLVLFLLEAFKQAHTNNIRPDSYIDLYSSGIYCPEYQTPHPEMQQIIDILNVERMLGPPFLANIFHFLIAMGAYLSLKADSRLTRDISIGISALRNAKKLTEAINPHDKHSFVKEIAPCFLPKLLGKVY